MTDYNDDRAASGDSGRPGWKKDDSTSSISGAGRDSDGSNRESRRPNQDSGRPSRDSGGSRGDSRRPERGSSRGDNRSGGSRPSFPRSDRPGRAGEGREGAARPDWQTRVDRPRDPERAKSPMIPEEITENDLDLLVRVQMKTLSPENAERVARHLAMVNLLIDQDPELAHQHAIAAADRAGRIGIVRETLALTAYTVGDFALALRELQAYRRISGKDDQLPIMVDCERGLGRPDKALELGRSIAREKLDVGVRVNLAIAMSGARLDKGQFDLALAELEIPELNPSSVFDYSPQLFRAYAHTMEILGRVSDAEKWHQLADRAIAALEVKNAPAVETIKVIEEYVIPDAYPSREDRAPRSDRGFDRDGNRGDSREGNRDGNRGGSLGGNREEGRGGNSEGSRGGNRDGNRSSDRPRRDFNDRGADRPRRDSGDLSSRDQRPSSGRSSSDRPREDRPREDRPKRDKYAGGFRIDHLDRPATNAGRAGAESDSKGDAAKLNDSTSDTNAAPKAKWKKSSDE